MKDFDPRKDRAAHAVMGFKVPRLWDPPYLQVALDIVDMGKLRSVLSSLPENDHLIIEAGTPLIKKFGLQVISEIRAIKPNAFIVADMKILDTGNLEARMAADSSADAVVMSGLAPASTIEKAITEARKTGIYSVIDMLNVEDPVGLIASLKVKPDIVELHRAIDAEHTSHAWGNIGDIKKAAGGKLRRSQPPAVSVSRLSRKHSKPVQIFLWSAEQLPPARMSDMLPRNSLSSLIRKRSISLEL
jgi:3-hexulose-6-phosphate synthase and related proteins